MLRASEIVQQLSKSRIFQDYESAFGQATRLPLGFRPPEIWRHALHGKPHENPFCALMAASSGSCAACLRVQQRLTEGKPGETVSIHCFAGLCDTAVPVTIGNEIVGYLQTGQVALRKPTKAGYLRITRQLIKWGVTVDLKQLQEAYFHGKILTKGQYEAMIRLLEIFAKHLSVVANQILVAQEKEIPPLITRAKKLIAENQSRELSLDEVARTLSVSTFYFCKMFKKATGMTFTDYLGRTRVERAKNLLLNPHARVSEVAYDCGFASLTHFNRVFKRVVGQSPSVYRRSLPAT